MVRVNEFRIGLIICFGVAFALPACIDTGSPFGPGASAGGGDGQGGELGGGGAGGSPPASCVVASDCPNPVPACRTTLACDNGRCMFVDAPAGMPVPEQTPGDCAQVVCDGAGSTVTAPDAKDLEDDGNPCTVDLCKGSTPIHTPAQQAKVPCYSGPPGTAGVGICLAGVQQCDPAGNPVGACEGEVTPTAETCLSPVDEDCDGQVDEDGAGCACGDGAQAPFEGCDDGNTVGGDGCSATCQSELALQVVVGQRHACALLAGGIVKCWGSNAEGQLGAGSVASLPACLNGPTTLPAVDLGPGAIATALAAGGDHTCALLSTGDVKCWGRNGAGQLGLEDANARGDGPGEMGSNLPAVDLGPGAVVEAITAGAAHTCAILAGGGVKCWGENASGQLGLGTTENRGDDVHEMGSSLPLVDLGSGDTAVAIAAGAAHTCAVLADGGVKCWGSDANLQLGFVALSAVGDAPGEMGDHLPRVALGQGATAISAGFEHTCAVLAGGELTCWGANAYGQLGLGSIVSVPASAQLSVNLGAGAKATAISAGGQFTCATLSSSDAKCWGRNDVGQLGLGDTVSRGGSAWQMGNHLPAIDLGTGLHASAIGAGWMHACAVLDNGSVKCWGFNHDGRLGLCDKVNRGDNPGEMGDSLPSIHLF